MERIFYHPDAGDSGYYITKTFDTYSADKISEEIADPKIKTAF